MTSLADQWREIYNKKFISHSLSIMYDPIARKIELRHEEGFSSKHENKTFKVENSSDIDFAIVLVKEELKNKEYKEDEINKILSEIENLKYIEGTSCSLFSIKSTEPDVAFSITPILKQITNKISRETEDPNSFLITKFNVEKIGEVELRAKFDSKDSEEGTLYLYSISGDVTNLAIQEEEGIFHILHENKVILSIEQIEKKKDVVKVYRPSSSKGLSSEVITLKLNGLKNNIPSDLVFHNELSQIELKDNIKLSKDSVAHYGVIRSKGSEVYYKAISENELSFSKYYNFEEQKGLVESEFIRCMRKYKGRDSTITEDELRKSCVRVAELESIVFTLINHNMSISDQGSLSKNNIRSHFKQCLKRENVTFLNKNILLFNIPFIKINESEDCIKNLVGRVEKGQFLESINNDFELNSIISDEEVISEYRRSRLEKFSECSKLPEDEYPQCINDLKINKNKDVLRTIVEVRSRSINSSNATSDFNNCSLEKDIKECFLEEILFIEKNITDNSILDVSNTVLPDSALSFSSDDISLYKKKYQECISGISSHHLDLLEFLVNYNESIYSCKEKVLRSILPETLSKNLLEKDPYNFFEGKQRTLLLEIIKEEVRKIIKSSVDTNTLRNRIANINDDLLVPYSAFYIESKLDDSSLSKSDKKSIRTTLLSTLGGNHKDDLVSSIYQRIETNLAKGRDQVGFDISNELIKVLEIELYKKENENSFTYFEKCMGDYNPKWRNIRVEHYVKKCKRTTGINEFLNNKREEIENLVSKNLDLNSIEANNALTPIYYFEKCLSSISVLSISDESMEKEMNGCFLITKLDVSRNILDYKVDSNKELLNDDGSSAMLMNTMCHENMLLALGSKIQKLADEDRDEYSRKYLNALRPLMDKSDIISLYSKSHEKLGSGSLLENYVYGDEVERNRIKLLINVLGNQTISSDDWVSDYSNKCSDNIDRMLYTSFRKFILNKIPSLEIVSEDSEQNKNREILTSVFNNELLSEILTLTDSSSFSFGVHELTDGQGPIVTGELSNKMLANLISTIANYLNEGLIFDEEAMETELIVFRSELTRALKWVNSQKGQVELSTLKDFFKSTRLADILAYAVVSKNVGEIFSNYIDQQETIEKARLLKKYSRNSFDELNSSEQKELKALINKFEQMRNETKRMTSSYDFKRLFRDGSEEANSSLEIIKNSYLLPLMINGETTASAQDKVFKIVSALIIKDDANGGFAERFAATSANEFLKNDRDSRWSITKYLFYDEGDFEWEALRETKAGSRAINYYTKSILLPEVTGQKLSPYTVKSRSSYFKRLLQKAQSENKK